MMVPFDIIFQTVDGNLVNVCPVQIRNVLIEKGTIFCPKTLVAGVDLHALKGTMINVVPGRYTVLSV